jgi:tRNA nucleotidyltransferase/poly(A) polymerase
MAAGSPEQQQRSVVVRETVELTETEERIFNRLLEVVRHFGLGTQLRVAGGWVRDKVSFSSLYSFFFPFTKRKLSLAPLDVDS